MFDANSLASMLFCGKRRWFTLRDRWCATLDNSAKIFDNEFALEGMSAFQELEGKRFSELGPYKAELEATTIRCIILRKENPPNQVQEIVSRLNQGAVRLTDQPGE